MHTKPVPGNDASIILAELLYIASGCFWFSSKDCPSVQWRALLQVYMFHLVHFIPWAILISNLLLIIHVGPATFAWSNRGTQRSRLTCRRDNVTAKPDIWNPWGIPLKGTNSLKDACSRRLLFLRLFKVQIVC